MWKWIKRLLLGLLSIIGIFILALAGIIIWNSIAEDDSTALTNVAYQTTDGTEVRGYYVEPEGTGPHPAVVLIHEWWGFNEGMVVLADALAEEGYAVLAVDAYRGKLTESIPRALFLRLTTPDERVFLDVDAGLSYLMTQENIDVDKIASMGFCFGGGHSLQLGMRQSENLAVTVMYYGAMETMPSLLEPLKKSDGVLGIFGAEDQGIPTAEVLEFEAALNSLDIKNQITIYEGVGHAFLTEDNYNQPGTAGDAWQETLAFLEENLKQ